ncbi:GyrI-like domain-containing protein [Cellvibrio sp. UBA7661]|uniref:GyrI-like domain-containing protein n=1 Tax=Cellvibrio sp. UBA7661 TaxID=1946311 RepID=UPI002F3572D7
MNATNNTLPDTNTSISQPRIEHAGPLLIAGLREPLDEHAQQKIPQLWQRLVSVWDDIPQRLPPPDYGLCIHLKNREYYYMAGVAVWDFDALPALFSPFIIPSQTYAAFTHNGSVNHIRDTIDFAFEQWLSQSGYQHASAAENSLHFFERYGEKFDPQTGEGDIEIWIPITER